MVNNGYNVGQAIQFVEGYDGFKVDLWLGVDSWVRSEMLDQFVWDIDGYDAESSHRWTGVELPQESVGNNTTKYIENSRGDSKSFRRGP